MMNSGLFFLSFKLICNFAYAPITRLNENRRNDAPAEKNPVADSELGLGMLVEREQLCWRK